jgi:hypothetical protein
MKSVEAHGLDPVNKYVMHNLAVSPDRLGQPRLAELETPY